MEISMVAQEFTLTPSLREHVERRVRFAFSHALNRAGRIVVRLRDLNGPRGGRDMACHVSVSVPGHPEVVVQEVEENMYNAIDRAIKRAAYRASRLVVRRRLALRRKTEAAPVIDSDAENSPHG